MANCIEIPVGVHVSSDKKAKSYFGLKDIAAHALKVAESCGEDERGCLPRVETHAGFDGYLCVIVARSADEASECLAEMLRFIGSYNAKHRGMRFLIDAGGF